MTEPTARNLSGYLAGLLFLFAAVPPARALRNLPAGSPIPPFSVTRGDGETLTNETCKGKVTLILFLRPEHEDSLEALAVADDFVEADSGANLAVVAVSTRDDPKGVFRALLQQQQTAIDVAADPKRKMYSDFGVIVTPTALLVDGKGILRYVIPHLPPGYGRRLQTHADFLFGKIDENEHARRLELKAETESKAARSYSRRLAYARLMVRAGKLDAALPVLGKLRAEKPASASSAALLATIHLLRGEVRPAADLLAPFAGAPDPSADLRLARARLALAEKKPEEAEKQLAEIEKPPARETASLFLQLGRLYEKKGTKDQALAAYRRALEVLFPRNE